MARLYFMEEGSDGFKVQNVKNSRMDEDKICLHSIGKDPNREDLTKIFCVC